VNIAYLFHKDGRPVRTDELEAVLKPGMTTTEAIDAVKTNFTVNAGGGLDFEMAVYSLNAYIKRCCKGEKS